MSNPTNVPLGRVPLPFTPQDLKEDMLFGIPLSITDTTGVKVTYPDSAIRRCITAAVNSFERDLQIDLWPRRVFCRPAVTHPGAKVGDDYDLDEDPLDYNSVAYYANGYIRLRRWPILSVEKLELRFPEATSIFTYPPEWLRITHQSGQIHILAIAGVAQPGIIAREGGYLPLLTGGFLQADVPQLIYCDYTSGLDWQNKNVVDQYQDLFLNLQRQAAVGVLQAVGRGVRPGVTSESLSEDGQSEGTSYYRGKGGLYGLEIEAMQAEIKSFQLSFKAAHKGVIFTVL